MIEHRDVDGRQATVVYLDSQFEPVDKQDAELVKVIYDDGDVVFLTPEQVE